MIQLICMITSSRAFKELFMLNEEKIKIMNKLAMYEKIPSGEQILQK